jgi:hypothetical protein
MHPNEKHHKQQFNCEPQVTILVPVDAMMGIVISSNLAQEMQ